MPIEPKKIRILSAAGRDSKEDLIHLGITEIHARLRREHAGLEA